jgi:hypothetical protein
MRTTLCLSYVALLIVAAACAPLGAPATAPAGSPDQPVSATPLPPGSSPEPAPTPAYAPQPGDAALTRGEVFLDSAQVVIRESFPPQVALALAGSLPTPCHQLRVAVAAPDAQGRIQVDAYTVVDPAMICIQVLESFEQSVPLNGLPAGSYTVWVNGEQVGEFTA